MPVVQTPEEQAERGQIAVSRLAIAQQLQTQQQRSAAARARIEQLLADLPAAHDEGPLKAAAEAVTGARSALATAGRSLLEIPPEAGFVERTESMADAAKGRYEQSVFFGPNQLFDP